MISFVTKTIRLIFVNKTLGVFFEVKKTLRYNTSTNFSVYKFKLHCLISVLHLIQLR